VNALVTRVGIVLGRKPFGLKAGETKSIKVKLARHHPSRQEEEAGRQRPRLQPGRRRAQRESAPVVLT
jgi:hypothetical protein